ncbi:hypothetical protein F2Q68_00019611 [Brassica cretica]|uniref:Uncharacterized protein n=1 Tax=Brassica cretica TaxID=69181 RepID=A0A8S9FS31_BRACR|nr:hypothetical protein F2Q68_00019611 [Brassica cretica]
MGEQLTLKYSAFHLLLAISRSVKKSRLAVFHGCCVLQCQGVIAPVGEVWNAKKECEFMGVDMLLVDER